MTSVVYLNFSKSIWDSATVLSSISVKTISIHCLLIPGSTVSVGSLPAGMVTSVGRSFQTGDSAKNFSSPDTGCSLDKSSGTKTSAKELR